MMQQRLRYTRQTSAVDESEIVVQLLNVTLLDSNTTTVTETPGMINNNNNNNDKSFNDTATNNNPNHYYNNNNNSNNIFSSVPTTLSTILGVMFFCLVCYSMGPNRSPEAQRRIRRYKKRKFKKERPDLRIQRIQQSLCIQRVVHVDEDTGQVQLQDVLIDDENPVDDDISNSSSAIESADGGEKKKVKKASYDDDDYYDNDLIACCGICLEPYRVNDIVAWSNSTSEECLHVFHKDCVQPWLENPKHDDCPQCRTIILQPAQDNSSVDSDDSIDDEHQRNINNITDTNLNNDSDSEDGDDDIDSDHNIHMSNNNSVVYYIMHGLISRANHVKFSLIGQTISIDSDDSEDNDGLYRSSNTDQQPRLRISSGGDEYDYEYESESSTGGPAAIAFRRAKSFSERMFSFSSSIAAATNRQHQQQNIQLQEWKSISMVDDSTNKIGERRRASTKLIITSSSDHNNTDTTLLQQPHDFRRVVSAGPCTPLDCRIRLNSSHSQHSEQQSQQEKEGDAVVDNEHNTNSLEQIIVPLRRELSSNMIRKRLFSQGTISDCDEEDIYHNNNSNSIDDEEQQIIIRRRVHTNDDDDEEQNTNTNMIEMSDRTEEDDIILYTQQM